MLSIFAFTRNSSSLSSGWYRVASPPLNFIEEKPILKNWNPKLCPRVLLHITHGPAHQIKFWSILKRCQIITWKFVKPNKQGYLETVCFEIWKFCFVWFVCWRTNVDNVLLVWTQNFTLVVQIFPKTYWSDHYLWSPKLVYPWHFATLLHLKCCQIFCSCCWKVFLSLSEICRGQYGSK